jgi:Flp pilus assembly protein TadD
MRLAVTLLAPALLAGSTAWADKRLDQAVAKAEAQLARGREDEAVRILQREVARARRDAEAPLALMGLLERLGRRDEARAALATAGERAGSAPPALRSRVLTLQSALALREGTAGDALALAGEAVAASADAESLAALARAQARLGLGAARETAERAVLAGPGSAAAHVARGDALLAAHLAPDAEAAYRQAALLDPASVSAHAGLAAALVARGRADAALEAARAATRADPRSAEGQAALGLATLAQDPADAAARAVVVAQQAVFLEPTNPLPKHVLGRVFESRGQLEQARAAYGEAAALDPSWPAPRLAVLAVRLREGDADGALAALRALSGELRAAGEAELLLGRLLAKKEEWAGAAGAFARAAALLPGLAEAHALEAEAAYQAGDLTAAADAWGRAVALDPANAAYRSGHALHLAWAGRLEEAVAALLALRETPEGRSAETLLALGDVYRSFAPPRVAEAVAAYQGALKLDPKSGQAALGVARSYRAGRQWARAIAAYERLADAFPRLEREALVGTAWCYVLSGDDTRARFYTGLAARAGADVGPLRRALTTKGAATDDAERAELAGALRSRNAGEQARAVVSLLRLGRPAVPALASALGRAETSLPARERIVDGLARLGPAAREALAQLDRVAAAAPPPPGPQESDEQRSLREREARLSAAARAASEAVRGTGGRAP